jgi:hypothetical protein
MARVGIATVYPSANLLDEKCGNCVNNSRCRSGLGLTLPIRNIQHLFLPDYRDSWWLSIDVPECRHMEKFFSLAKITASLNTGNKKQVLGKVIEKKLGDLAELYVVEM